MTERTYRLFQGGIILFGLILESDLLIYTFIAVSAFEGITGMRIPVIVSRTRKRDTSFAAFSAKDTAARFSFDAERMMRLTVLVLLGISYFIFPEETWFFPWFMGAMLVMAGISNVCPMVIYYRWLGFR